LTHAAAIGRTVQPRLLGISLEHVRSAAVWLMLASSFYVIVEPAPTDVIFILTLLLFLPSGLRISPLVFPMILCLLLYNLGGFISYIVMADNDKAGMFVVASVYMGVSAVLFAFYLAESPEQRMVVIKRGYIAGAFIASVIGILSYFDVAGLATLSPMGRAQGTYKDPNVLSTYIILPALFLIQDVMLRSSGSKLVRFAALLTILACLFLSFSRGAWLNFVFSTVMMIGLTFMLTPSARLRSRIVMLTMIGVGIATVLIMYLLTIEEVRMLFYDRLTLVKSYDTGETGRFGRQLNALGDIFLWPLGFGPMEFGRIYGQDPHNVFLNAFASYGWLGGISYLLLIIGTIIVGFKSLLVRSPWQNAAIVLFCPFIGTVIQGVQIDTDHWRHFYWMLGMIWGLYAASATYVMPTRRSVPQPA
jgi:O-antigen ligase